MNVYACPCWSTAAQKAAVDDAVGHEMEVRAVPAKPACSVHPIAARVAVASNHALPAVSTVPQANWVPLPETGTQEADVRSSRAPVWVSATSPAPPQVNEVVYWQVS